MTLDARRKRQAREHAAAIDQHRTGAALSLVAALLAAGQPQMLPQRVEQGGAHISATRCCRSLISRRKLTGSLDRLGFASRASACAFAARPSAGTTAVEAVTMRKFLRL